MDAREREALSHGLPEQRPVVAVDGQVVRHLEVAKVARHHADTLQAVKLIHFANQVFRPLWQTTPLAPFIRNENPLLLGDTREPDERAVGPILRGGSLRLEITIV